MSHFDRINDFELNIKRSKKILLHESETIVNLHFHRFYAYDLFSKKRIEEIIVDKMVEFIATANSLGRDTQKHIDLWHREILDAHQKKTIPTSIINDVSKFKAKVGRDPSLRCIRLMKDIRKNWDENIKAGCISEMLYVLHYILRYHLFSELKPLEFGFMNTCKHIVKKTALQIPWQHTVGIYSIGNTKEMDSLCKLIGTLK